MADGRRSRFTRLLISTNVILARRRQATVTGMCCICCCSTVNGRMCVATVWCSPPENVCRWGAHEYTSASFTYACVCGRAAATAPHPRYSVAVAAGVRTSHASVAWTVITERCTRDRNTCTSNWMPINVIVPRGKNISRVQTTSKWISQSHERAACRQTRHVWIRVRAHQLSLDSL